MDHFAVRNIANIAKEKNVGRITLISAYAVSEEKADSPESRSKVRGESALKSNGVPYTIFRCSWFMETLPLFVQGNSISLIGNRPHPLHWISVEDYGRMVSKSYQTDETLNKELYIFGSEAFTMGEVMKMYADHTDIKVALISTMMLSVLGALTLQHRMERHGNADETLRKMAGGRRLARRSQPTARHTENQIERNEWLTTLTN